MHEVSGIQPANVSKGISLPKLNIDPLRAVPVILYLVAYFASGWVARIAGVQSTAGQFAIVSGLNLALLLGYGLWLSPAIILASVADGLWFHPIAPPATMAFLYCLAIPSAQIAAVLGFTRVTSGNGFSLKQNRDLAISAAFVVITSTGLALLTTLPSLFGSAQWNRIPAEFRVHWLDYLTGILCLTPALAIHAVPWLETLLFRIKSEKRFVLSGSRYKLGSQAILVSSVFVLFTASAIYFISRTTLGQPLYIALLISVPLVAIALLYGIEGLSIAVPALAGISIATMLYLRTPADTTESVITILVVCSLYAYMIAAGVTRSRAARLQMEGRDAVLGAAINAAQLVLESSSREAGIKEIVKRIGEAASVSQAFLLEIRGPRSGILSGDSCFHEWSTSSLPIPADRHALNSIRVQMIEELSGRLSFGQPYLYRTKHADQQRQKILQGQGIRSGVITPIFIEHQLWGCLGLEERFIDRDWSDSEIDGLRVAAEILGMIFASSRTEQRFRQLTANIPAVFWISSADGRAKQYVSPGYEAIWGQSCTSVQRDPESWLSCIHPEDRERIAEAVAKQISGEYNEEFRIQRPDGSTRWIHDRAFPVRGHSGDNGRIAGFAEDITGRKEEEEHLRGVAAMLSSLIDNLDSGVLVEDNGRKIIHVNEAFKNIFRISAASQSLLGSDSRLLLPQPAPFAERIENIIKAGIPVWGEELEYQGRSFLRNYVPMSISQRNQYHLWKYQDNTESRRAEAQIKASLKEKEVLLKEIHHRVKNNLQIISSLLNLQSGEIEDPKASQKFTESQDRVKAMALIHERLYQSGDLATIDFPGYVRNLAAHLFRSYKVNAAAIRMTLKIESVPMSLDVAIPCGLIVNELISNAFKYAFPPPKEGEIAISFSAEGSNILKLIVADNGVGFPGDCDPEKTDSLGLKLVRTLTEQLGGTLRYVNRGGFLCEISIPQPKTGLVQ